MVPDFAEWLLETPEAERVGRVFKLPSLIDGQPLALGRVSPIVARIERKAGVIVNKSEGDYATAHSLRRSFGTRWSRSEMPATGKKLMRHASIQTTTGSTST